MIRSCRAALLLVVAGIASATHAQNRSRDNALTQAEDGFGFSVGRETLGIYNAGNARGFSPTAAGNVRIEGLYFDPAFGLSSIVASSTSIKVGLSAQGYPFVAPSGIVDIALRRPQERAAASIVVNGDSFGSYGIEVNGSLPASENLSVGYGASAGRVAFPDGTDNLNHGQGLIARWQPLAGVDILPFWSLNNDYGDDAGPFYIPGGKFLPPLPPAHQFDGPRWVGIRYAATNHGVLASAAPAENWLARIGLFRSVNDQKAGYSNLLINIRPDGAAERIVIADPRLKNVSLSGEARLTHSIADGPRLHVFHLSARGRDVRNQFGGSAEVALGPTRIGERDTSVRPALAFSPVSRSRVRQATYGVAYDGRWKNVGEVSGGVARADYRKTTLLPGVAPIVSHSQPWLYNGTIALSAIRALSIYAGYAKGLEQSGIAPANAANRNEPLPAILTQQTDAGLRWTIAGDIRAIGGLFALRRPYFGFNAANVFTQVGTTRSRGAEFSVSGSLTKRLNLVAGGYFLRPRVERQPGLPGIVGARPVGVASRLLNLNINWRTPMVEGFALDAAIFARGRVPATIDNVVTVPSREQLNLGARYQFKLAGRDMTLRLQAQNVFDDRGFNVAGPGIFGQNSGRYLTGYLAVDV